VQFAASKKLAEYHDEKAVRRVILLISDGEDNQSRATSEQVIEAARRAEVTVYAVSSNPGNTKTTGNRLLEKLAEETGGRVFFPSSLTDVGQAFKTIEEELRSQYALSYKPAGFLADGRFRRIEIRTPDKNTLIRARKGYFAPSR
jgi:VWFA-related protein